MYRLLRKEVSWNWNNQCDRAFHRIKKLLCSNKLLVHYHPSRPLLLACDASPYGVGAVLSHKMSDGSEKPVYFASRSLSKAEQNYSQIDKEGLAVVFGVKKFRQFLYGRQFTIISDHRPLLGLLGEGKPIPPNASARVQRWALTLSAYDHKYKLIYKRGTAHSNCDGLSRLPLPDQPASTPLPGEVVLLLREMDQLPITAKEISTLTGQDPLLSRVRKLLMQGWPENVKHVGEAIRPYHARHNELSVQDGCVLWGSRVVIPPQVSQQVILQLHDTHHGIVRMKSLARGYLWWPKIDLDLERCVKLCSECQKYQKKPAQAPLNVWKWPDRPWSRLHMDYAGPYMGKMFFILVDAHSKWLEVHQVSNATSSATIEKLRFIFSTHGLSETLVSDNGSCFTSTEFKDFVTRNGIVHLFVPPYHAASNGLAERAVQTFKSGMKRLSQSHGSLDDKIARFLFHYRITTNSTTGIAPAELLFGRRLRSHLDLLHPDTTARVDEQQRKQAEYHDRHARARNFVVGDAVYITNFSVGDRWLPGVVVNKSGPVSFHIELADGRTVRRHLDHVCSRLEKEESLDTPVLGSTSSATAATPPTPAATVAIPSTSVEHSLPVPIPSIVQSPTVVSSIPQQVTSPELIEHSCTTLILVDLRRSSRVSKPPDRLGL